MPDDDFMGGSFENYDITENRMSDDGTSGGAGGVPGRTGDGKPQLTVLGSPTKTSRVGIGLAVLIFGIIIGLAVSGDQETAAQCLGGAGIILGSIVAMLAICFKK